MHVRAVRVRCFLCIDTSIKCSSEILGLIINIISISAQFTQRKTFFEFKAYMHTLENNETCTRVLMLNSV